MSTNVLITGGTGRTARQLIDTLLNHPDCPPLRVLVKPQGVETLKESFPLLSSAPHSIFAADYMDEETLNPAFQNVSIVVHNGPSVHQNEVAMAISVIEAAKKAKVGFFIFCSVLHPMRSKLVTHRMKLAIEEYLVESRINYCILHPTHYMQNVSFDHIMQTGKIPLGYSQTVEQGFIDLRDFASVVREIILDPMKHNRATYELVGENRTYAEVAEILQRTLNREVKCEFVPTDRYMTMLRESGVIQSEYAEDAMERIIVYHNRWGLTGNANVLGWLLGREPRTWEEYATDMLGEM